ncbi:MAG: MBL fold metallo-hydrolase [Gemmatimonadota bacterium]|nr:MBL fold metallo-hydrolase [Gemmatimonadota bacterium]
MKVPAQLLEPDLWRLDLDFQRTEGVVAAYLITDRHGHTLVETGPGSTLPALERAVSAAGADLDDVTQLLVTHIHLDHAGAAGALLRRLPHARLFVHPAGAPHMIDPSKLIASATRIYGGRMDLLWGAFEPCPSERVVTLADAAEVRCGRRTLHALHTPGHASHHIAFLDPEHRTVFTGDLAGVRLNSATYVRPPTPPPDIDIEAWHASVNRLRAANPRALDLTHFGRFADPTRHLDELMRRLDQWTAWAARRLGEGATPDVMVRELRDRSDAEILGQTADPSLAEAYELGTPSGMTVDGLVRYLSVKRSGGHAVER